MERERTFYSKHHLEKIGDDKSGPESFEKNFKIPGHRYYCVHDSVTHGVKLRAIELGFGDVGHCFYFGKYFREFHAIDIASKEILERVGSQFGPMNFTVQDHNLNEDFPFEHRTFDVLIAVMIVEHLFDPFHSFSEISRVLREDGKAFINLPLVTSWKNRLRLAMGNLPMTSAKSWWRLEEWDGGHLHYFNIDYVRKLGDKYGLELESIYPVGKAYALKRVFPTLLCSEASFVFRKRIERK